MTVLSNQSWLTLIGSLQIKVVMGKHKDDQNKLEDAGKVTSSAP